MRGITTKGEGLHSPCHPGVVERSQRYGLLTIGDGLVTQIPALVLSTAAGLLVTRVASEEPDTSLGAELGAQLFGTPRALLLASAFVALLALVPGLPAVPFLVIAGLLFTVSRARLQRVEVERVDRSPLPASPAPNLARHKAPTFLPVIPPWTVELSSDLEALVDDRLRGDEVERAGIGGAIHQLRERLFADLGVPLPPPRLRLVDGMPPRHVVLLLSDVPARLIVLPDDLADEQAASHVADAVFELLRSRAADFLGMHEAQQLLDQLEQVAPAVVRQVVPKPLSLMLLTEVLRRLAEEGVSIRDLRLILEALATYAPQERDPMALTELTRSHLKRATTYRLTGGARSLEIYLLDTGIEEVIRSAITRTPAGSFLTLAPGPARDIVRAIKNTTSEVRPSETQPLVLLTQPDIRRFVRKLVEGELPELQVISFAELLPEIQLQPLARVEG